MQHSYRTALFIILGLGLVLLLLLALTQYFKTAQYAQKPFDPQATLANLNTENNIDDYLEIESMIGNVMEQYGTKAGFQLIDEGERQKIISNDQCHSLLHYVGHAAYAETPHDYETLLGIVEGTDCIGGYLHGIEAEIVLTSGNVVQEVQDFCTFQKEKGVNPGPCYHGIGHAGTELYNYDVPKSLALCDSLAGGPEDDLTNCYRGVFSEVGNVIVGYDGHTGLAIEKLTIDGLDPEDPFAYCMTLEERHQSSCKSQLVKVLTMELDLDDWLTACQDPKLDHHTKEICINIVSGVYMRHELSFKDSATLPALINEFPQDLRRIAMLGALETVSGYYSDGAEKDWRPFCNAFTDPDDVAYCIPLFETALANNEAPWMEYDIR